MKYKVKITNHIFGVPITFVIDHYDHALFLIIGVDESCGAGLSGGLRLRTESFCGSTYVNNRYVYRRLFIKFR